MTRDWIAEMSERGVLTREGDLEIVPDGEPQC